MTGDRVDQRVGERSDVVSGDGTSIAVFVGGDGPAIVVVHGSLSDHTTLDPLLVALQRGATTFAMDRRGFGASQDQPSYSIERDFEDVAAVVDEVAARIGGSVALFGHSYGANCAMGGATLTDNVSHLVLYEPSLGLQYPPGSIDAIEERVKSGDMESVIVMVLTDILEMSESEIDAMRASASPSWATRIATGHTVARECRVEEEWRYEPGLFDGITAPTLFLLGSESPPAIQQATRDAADAIPRADISVLEGHAHFAHRTDPSMVAALVTQFVTN